MDLSTLTRASNKRQARKRVGRGAGSGTGKTCGRGTKGQKSRSGYSRRPSFEGGQMPLNRRLPKRGFRHSPRHPMAEVNLDALEGAFEDGDEVTAAILVERGLARKLVGGVKILGRGDLTKKLVVRASAMSAGARAKIEGCGGTAEVLTAPPARAARKKRDSGGEP